MAGPRHPPLRDSALAFCEGLFAIADRESQVVGTAGVGPISCTFSVSGSGNATADLLRAFRPGLPYKQQVPQDDVLIQPKLQAGEVIIRILGREDVPVIPNHEWALPWIIAHEVIPESITFPYKVFIDRNTGVSYVYDSVNRSAVIHTRRHSETDLRGMITPFRLMWSWLAASFGGAIIHASAVQLNGGTILFSGGSGIGKSTIALELALRGYPLISDDAVWIQDNWAFPVFDRVKVDSDSSAGKELERRNMNLQSFPTRVESKNFFSAMELNSKVVNHSKISRIFFPHLWPVNAFLNIPSRGSFKRVSADSSREVFGTFPRATIRIASMCIQTPGTLLWLSQSGAENVEFIEDISRGLSDV